MKKYFLFPGQGSQVVGMGRELYDKEPSAKARFDQACDVLGFDLRKLCFEGPEAELKQTENTQPALFTVGYVVYECFLRKGFKPDFTAGHSLGEYTAIAAANGFDFATGLKLVRKRGELMSKAPAGKMAAVLGFDRVKLEAICLDCSTETDKVVPANFNAPDQIVISGHAAAVDKARVALSAAGAKRVIELPVSGAFHSPLMQAAAEEMKIVLAHAAIHDTSVPVISNVTAAPVTVASEIRELLYRQLFSPVRWTDAFEKAEAGLGVEMGPGKVLLGLFKKVNSHIRIVSAHTPAEIEIALQEMEK
ncbi:MAG: [acyl-carrier-protein] S-malonyltransferase [Elusimicrobia bacterium RIFOXYB2_FULL_49_7]|nr:MAG: [acyl-carrier-protein] S-malonyltransferase [Elusimicrobia bacterium RIFOXYB2_FULL_49_7]